MQSIQEISKDTQAIKDFLGDAPDGAFISYKDIENGACVEMDTIGKQKMRSAMRSLHREYACIRGVGIEIESHINALSLVNRRLIKVDNAVKRGEKTSSRMVKFIPKMNSDSAKHLLHVVSVFGAIKASAQLAKAEYKKRKNNILKVSN